jgi:hypothetical protein
VSVMTHVPAFEMSRNLTMPLCGIHNILMGTNRVSTSQPPIYATRPPIMVTSDMDALPLNDAF